MILGGEEMEVRKQMELFDKRFMYLEWDDKLKGKEVFLGDTLPQLRVSVNGNCNSIQEVTKNIDDDSFYPFISSCGTRYAMVYYDPNYSCKRAYMEGKTIQCRNKGDDNWVVTSSPNWVDRCEYRVKPENTEKTTMSWRCEDCVYEERDFREEPCSECVVIASGNKGSNWEPKKKHKKKRRWTNRELAQWIWQGNGQVKLRDGYCTLITCTAYDIRDDDKPCTDYLVVRGWDETGWHEPDVEE